MPAGFTRLTGRFGISRSSESVDLSQALFGDIALDLSLTPRQLELVELARSLAKEKFAPRSFELDRLAEFPFEDYKDLHDHGLLGLCVPERFGGMGEGFETYCLVAEQLAQGHAATALTYNMHCTTMLMMGPVSDDLSMSDDVRATHERRRALKFEEVVEEGAFYGQPHSEPVELGETDKALAVGGRRFGTIAEKVDGGYRVNGRKFFVSLSGAASYFATPALQLGDAPWMQRTLYLQVPCQAPGVEFVGPWDPTGMRATVSRDMVLTDVFIPDDGVIVPPGVFGEMFNRYLHGPMSFSATFLGLAQAAYDFAVDYLKGVVDGAPGLPGDIPIKANGVANMLFELESARALFYRAASEAAVDPSLEVVQRARAAHVSVQRAVVNITQEAMRICGGRAILKKFPLERYARDARASAVMRPWTQDIAVQQAGEYALGFGVAQTHKND